MPRIRTAALLLGALLLLLGGGSASAKNLSDLDGRQMKAVVEAARAYFDPSIEFLWRPRKEFKAALDGLGAEGVDPYRDFEFLKQVIYQGRHFLDEFSEKSWQKANNVDFKKSGFYMNVSSENLRFTYTTPKDYKSNQFKKIPRMDPFPLLLTLHELQDYTGQEYPGATMLERRYPRSDYRDLYDNWLVLAPVAARALFLADDQSIRHDFLTVVLSEFWQRYHVDFDRIVLDGMEAAAAIAASTPFLYAGVVLRGGTIDPALVRNFASVPVYVVGDEKLKKSLEEAGHPNVTLGDDAGVLKWIGGCRRTLARDFQWTMLRAPDHELANWIQLFRVDIAAPERTLDVKVVDTQEDPNTIQIEAKGIFEINLFLNDSIVDLDREVRVVINGHEEMRGKLERDIGTLFDREPNIRKNMCFGWLYTAAVQGLKVKPPAAPAGDGTATPGDGTPAPGDQKGSEEDEIKAAKYFDLATSHEKEGDLERAKAMYQKIIDLGVTSYKARAEERLAALEKGSADGG